MQVFKKLSTAAKHAQGGLIISVRIGGEECYIVGEIGTLTEVAVLKHDPKHNSWGYAGQVNAGHLVRLGNANHASAAPQFAGRDTLLS